MRIKSTFVATLIAAGATAVAVAAAPTASAAAVKPCIGVQTAQCHVLGNVQIIRAGSGR